MKGAKGKRNHNPRKRKRQPGDILRYTVKKVKKSKYFNVSWDVGKRRWLARKVFRKEIVINKYYDHEQLAALAVNWACEEIEGIEHPNTTLTNFCSAVVCEGGCNHQDSESWIRCQKCEMWFHAECTKLSEARLKKRNPNYICSMCIEGQPSWHNSKELVGETVSPTVSSDEEMENELEPIESEPEEGNSDPPANPAAPNARERRLRARRPVQLCLSPQGKTYSPEDDSHATLPEPSPPAPPRDPQMPPLEPPGDLQEEEEEQPAALSAPPVPLREVREVIDLSDSPRMQRPRRAVLRKGGSVRSRFYSEDEKGDEETVSSSGAAAAQDTIEEEASELDVDPQAMQNAIEEPQSVQNVVEENPSVQNIEQPRNPAPQQCAFNEDDVIAWAHQLDVESLHRVTAKMLLSRHQPTE